MRRIKRSTKQFLIALLIGIIVIGAGSIIAYILNTKKIESEYVSKIENLESEIIKNKQYIYTAKNKIALGDILSMEDLEFKEEYYSLNVSSESITDDDIGKRTLIEIEPGQAIYKNMIEPDLEYGLREMEYSIFRFNTNTVENDTVDIRLSLPNGDDFIVLQKKLLQNVDLESCKCNLWLNEEEILRLSSAIVDAANYDSAYLHVATYINSGQEESIVTYQPNEDVMLLIANNPNIVSDAVKKLNLRERKELEERLSKGKDEEIQSKNSLDDEENQSENSEGVKETNKDSTSYQFDE